MSAEGGRRWTQALLLLGVSTLFALLVAELAARFWLGSFADDQQFRRFASLDQLRVRMEREGQSVSPYVPHRYIGFIPAPGFHRGYNRHNRLGYRGDPIPQPKPEGEFRIVCLGGSTTYGSAVGAPRLAYPAQLQAALRALGHSNVRVVNAGAQGWASHESLVNFEFRVLDLDPDLVIVYHGLNDLNGRMVWPFGAFRGDNSGAVQHSPGLNRAVPLVQQSTLARILLILSGREPSQLALVSNFTVLPETARFFAFQRQKVRGVYPSGYFEQADIMDMLDHNPPVYFRRNLESLVAVARAQGVQPVLATFAHCDCVPDQPALTSREVVRGIREHNRVILELGESLAVPVYDFAAAFPRDPDLFASAVHLSVRGNRMKGKLFADFLVAAGLLSSAPGATQGQGTLPAQERPDGPGGFP